MKIEHGKKNDVRYARIEHEQAKGGHEVLVWKLEGELLFRGSYDTRAEALANLKCQTLMERRDGGSR